MDRAAATAAMQPGRAREQQLQVIVKLGHRADGRARGAHRVRLIDRYGRGNTTYCIDLRLVHALEELPGVGREGLDITALTLGVDRVEGERGFAGAAHPGDHGQLPERQFQSEVAQVVLARALDEDPVFHGWVIQQRDWR